ncbi:MAG TPA: PLP-dependent aminotransferase family protein [Bacteroidetes bacterium]|nr:PLP-dependent aminotransferase family protein [Bacteroidota bacterium]
MYAFSKSVEQLRSSEIRDLMKLATHPGIISFAGGMPNNDLFPIKEIEEIFNNLSDEKKKTAFQYGPTQGYPPLLKSLKKFLKTKGLPVESNKLLITTGSLQAINILTKEFIDPGDTIITENPSFIGAISVFKSYQARMESIPVNKDGIDIGILKKKIDHLDPKPKFIYLTPNFHNPAGITYSQEKRMELMEFLGGKDIIVIEDDAYNDLYFDDEAKKMAIPMKCNEPDDVTICYTGSFSKILGPGFRLGWLLVNDEIYEKCELIKQAMDACSPNFTQVLANEFLAQGKIYPYLDFLRKEYHQRKILMDKALNKYMPEYVSWNEPNGGFYFWCTLPAKFDSSEIMKIAIKNGAVFVSGKTFDPAGVKNNNFRLSFSNMGKNQIDKGIKIIADSIREYENSIKH